jgi:hypothetical protein
MQKNALFLELTKMNNLEEIKTQKELERAIEMDLQALQSFIADDQTLEE